MCQYLDEDELLQWSQLGCKSVGSLGQQCEKVFQLKKRTKSVLEDWMENWDEWECNAVGLSLMWHYLKLINDSDGVDTCWFDFAVDFAYCLSPVARNKLLWKSLCQLDSGTITTGRNFYSYILVIFSLLAVVHSIVSSVGGLAVLATFIFFYLYHMRKTPNSMHYF